MFGANCDIAILSTVDIALHFPLVVLRLRRADDGGGGVLLVGIGRDTMDPESVPAAPAVVYNL